MKTQIFAHDANPRADLPLFYAKPSELRFMLETGAVAMVGTRAAQYTREARDPRHRAKQGRVVMDYAAIETHARWMVVGQTKAGGAPGCPVRQMVRA